MSANRFGARGSIRLAAGLWVVFTIIVMSLGACQPRERAPTEEMPVLQVSSPAFREGEPIPPNYTAQGQDVSPPLAWSQAPPGTRSFALIMDDPDASGDIFTHWLLFNIPPDTRSLAEGVPTQARLPSGALQGRSDFGRLGYGGPSPPPGRPHRYRFALYALDQLLDLKAEISRRELLSAMQGHILAQGQLTGIYQR